MLKRIILLTTLLQVAITSWAHKADTTIMYIGSNGFSVRTLDSADHFILIMPSQSDPSYCDIQEYYKDGKIKLVGKSYGEYVSGGGEIRLDGDCVSYFPNGKRSAITHYTRGYKEGMEYFYCPEGASYCTLKNKLGGGFDYQISYLDCYDIKGNKICENGNGQWLIYDKNFVNVILQGSVKKGSWAGEWKGRTLTSDSIKYTCEYKNGFMLSGKGYDKEGKEYSFTKDIEGAHYWSGQIEFLKAFQKHLDLPKDLNGKKVSIDNCIISFIVERNGQLTNLQVITPVEPALKDALANAFAKCTNWVPRKNYGIPVRAKIIFPLKYLSSYNNYAFREEMYYNEKQIDTE